MSTKPIYIGIDIGSISADVVVVDERLNILEKDYIRTKGEPFEVTLNALEGIMRRYGADAIKLAAMTGSGGKQVASLIGAVFTNEVIAQAKATEHFHPEVRTVIEMGGQDAKLILLAPETDGRLRLEDFQMNSVCAAGTGSFLDQQAIRMNLTIEEFGQIALKSKNPPRIAGRCSVFAKSDMIHLQQSATPDYDIVAGLCYAVARNFKSTIGRGKEFKKPVAFQGGVAANPGVRNAFKDVLELNDDEYIVPEHFAFMGALGAVFAALEKNKDGSGAFKGVGLLKEFIESGRKQDRALEKLFKPVKHPSLTTASAGYELSPDKKIDVYLGIDVGSTSTNVVLIDGDMRLVSKRYLATAGRPLEAVRKGIEEVYDECGKHVNVIGVGSTGSGRYLTGDFVGADVIRNEITAQATAAVEIDPQVDTIFEIGGQDSKYIALKDGVIVDFEMNKVCAAGTGSFLEEQAERLGISIKNEFSSLAISSPTPAPMGERCTVFIETDMVHHQQKGVDKGGLVAGLAYSIVHNYLNRVVGDRRIGERIFFQGGTAANLAVVSAFEKVTGKPITVPPNHDVTGAIGAAILAMREKDPRAKTRFKGFDCSKKKYQIESFECRDCANVCEIRKVVMQGEEPLYYGGRCEKYDVKRAAAKVSALPDLFKERERLLFSSYKGKKLPIDAPVIGIPRTLMMYELYPFFKAFFDELGLKVILSSPTNREIIKQGVEGIVTETCFPAKVAHGHIKDLMDKGVKRIFLPSIINMAPTKKGQHFTVVCPYVQSIPYMAKSAFDFGRDSIEVISPAIRFNQRTWALKRDFHELGKILSRDKGAVNSALEAAFKAQAEFRRKLLERGAEILSGLKEDSTALVIIGRSYNTADSGINLELPDKLRGMNTLSIPMDMLPVDDAIDDTLAADMYWRSGQKILAAAKLIREDKRLFAVYITNFGCGPDSFITHFFKNTSVGKPFLQLEIDEHSADAGAITRCEAFLDSLRNTRGKGAGALKAQSVVERMNIKKKLYVPYMADGAYAIAAAFQACGIDAEVIPMPDEESLKLGRRYTSGRECYPAILTTGDMIKTVRKPDFDPKKSAFFMPSGCGPCRFGQYNRYHRLILDELGLVEVPVYAPDQDEKFYKELDVVSKDFPKLGWWGIAAVDLLEKRLREVRPYEKNKGSTDKVYWDCVHRVCSAIRDKRFPSEEFRYAKDAFNKIPVDMTVKRPLVGIVGEIYVRSNRFSNENIVKTLEMLGAEVRVPPVGEWIYYTNYIAKKRSLRRGNYRMFLKTLFNDFFQKRFERSLLNAFNGDLRGPHEIETKEILNMASPYIKESFEGEAVLSVGKVIDYIANSADGVVNVMPFTCMPGTVVNGVLKRVREKHSDIPYLNMVYEGIEDANSKTRLEAFVHQAREFMERRQG